MSKFNEGDRVRVVGHLDPNNNVFYSVGNVGTVTEVFNDLYEVKFDADAEGHNTHWFVDEENIVLENDNG